MTRAARIGAIAAAWSGKRETVQHPRQMPRMLL